MHAKISAERFRDSPGALTAGLLALAAVFTSLALYAFYTLPESFDFRIFYDEGVAWNAGAALYASSPDFPNLNSPYLTITVFSWLARLPYPLAQTVWVVLEIAGLFGSLRVIARRLRLDRQKCALILALLLITHGAFFATMQGQLTWLLLYPVTCAWAAYRDQRPVRAGVWLATAIVAKPPLALLALGLHPRVWLTAGAISAIVTALSLGVTGWLPWADWLRVGSHVPFLPYPANASLWGMAARMQEWAVWGVRMEDLSREWVAAVLASGLYFLWRTWREPDRDRRYLLAVLCSLLLSPLGWRHYFPLAWAPAVALWPQRPLIWVAYALSLIPVHGATSLNPVSGSLYFASLVCAWIAWTHWSQKARCDKDGG